MIDRLGSSGGPPPAQVEKPRQSGRGFADWLEREQRTAGHGDEARPDASNAFDASDASDAFNAPDASDASQRTVQIAEPSADFPDVQIELHRAAGELEVISLPWKLAGNGSLSQRLLQQASVGLSGRDAVAGMTNAVAREPASASTDAWLPPTMQEWRQMGASGGFLAQSARAAMDVDSVDVSSPSATRTQAAMPWLLRLFRWLEQKGHDPSIWLRDYRLDQTDAHQLAEALRTHASEQGIHLERIVVNGRELWRAPSRASEGEL